ncbi:MAG: stage V sporulation T C-terminal domain-containing protein [Clostridia bacterium]|nr:stage V sporulation T C-terminal domain-containing protein [Clostridia bacterium]MDD4375443.1 stage V sporulation T C-terminal domain-containing protein [Clostridia bacterium]
MKATGIIRRIDNLGRIVLPKETRKSLKIKEGDMLEIYVQDSGAIILEKYEPIDNLSKLADDYTEVLSTVTGLTVCITNYNYVVSISGASKKDYHKKELSQEVLTILDNRSIWSTKNKHPINLVKDDDKSKYKVQIIVPIIDNGDIVGGVMAFSTEPQRLLTELEIRLIQTVAILLNKQV